MTDPIFQRFYKDVRDPSWPDVDHYGEFVSLPSEIQNECLKIHGVSKRLQEITNLRYWNDLKTSAQSGWRYKDIVFLPIPKCGLNYYNNLFGNILGWESCPLSSDNYDQYSIVSCIIHPLTRYLKGLTEWIWMNRDQWCVDLLVTLCDQSQLMFPDGHSIPLTLTYPDIISKMTLIPSDIWSDQKTRCVLMDVCKNLGHPEIVLPLEDQRLHQSEPNKINIFNRLKKTFLHKADAELLLVYQIFSQDLNLYNQAVDKFSH